MFCCLDLEVALSYARRVGPVKRLERQDLRGPIRSGYDRVPFWMAWTAIIAIIHHSSIPYVNSNCLDVLFTMPDLLRDCQQQSRSRKRLPTWALLRS